MVMQVQQSKHHFGLPDSTYASLCSSVTHIVHAAWPMDFKRTLASFETQFAFLHNLLRLARDAHTMRPWLRPRLAFISSISVVGQYHHCHDGARIVPEEIMDGNESTNSFGYAHAKLVCENILSRVAASRKKEMEVCCIRLGQIAGASAGGFWNPKEHVPALISIAQRMRKWPKLKGVGISNHTHTRDKTN
jgi:thioester reductase-like protein